MVNRRKVGVEIFYWINQWSENQADYFAKAVDAGFDGVEISLIPGQLPSAAGLQRELDHHGLGVACSTGLTPATDVSSSDPDIKRSGIEHLTAALEISSALGSSVLAGVTFAPWLHFPADADLQPYRERSAEALAEVASVADGLGVELCLEILNRFETYMFNTVTDGLEFLQMVDHPAVKLELDTFHMNIEEDSIPDAILLAAEGLGHFQCASNSRRAPQHASWDWAPIKDALDAVDYRGWIVFETFPNPHSETGRSTYTWRQLVENPDHEAGVAAAFLKEQLA